MGRRKSAAAGITIWKPSLKGAGGEEMKVTYRMMNKELRVYGKLMQIFLSGAPTLQKMKKSHERMKKSVENTRPENILCEEKYISREGKKDLRMFVLKPQHPVTEATGILSIHGGGYVMGTPEAA